MIEQMAIPTPFGMAVVIFDDSLIGVDADGNPTSGAVTKVTIGEPLSQEVRMTSATCGMISGVRFKLLQWLSGDFDALRGIGVQQPGTQFKQDVWQAMRNIPAGTTATYTELAAAAGHVGATRAAASVCATNAIPLIVPCHRVVAADGLGGYFYGTDMKAKLLSLEGVDVSSLL